MSTISKLAGRGSKLAARVLDAYNPDQERDDRGRWGSGGLGSGASTAAEHTASARSHELASNEHHARGEHEAGNAHGVAGLAHRTAAEAAAKAEAANKSLGPRSVYPRVKEPIRESIERGGKMQAAGRATRAAQEASTKANAESAKVGATPISRKQTQAGSYRGNPAKEGSNADKRIGSSVRKPVTGRETQLGGNRYGVNVVKPGVRSMSSYGSAGRRT